jgi:hypothetical protein
MALPSGADAFTMTGKTGLEFRFGVRDQENEIVEYDYSGVVTRSEVSDIMVGLGLIHWTDENLAFTFQATAVPYDTREYYEFGALTREQATVATLFVGLRYYFPMSNYHAPVRPYLTVAGGPVLGVTERDVLDYYVYEEVTTETVMGAHFGGGVDFQLGRHLLLGVSGGYNSFQDFSIPVRDRFNYSGPEFGVGLTVVFGR